jgi:MFS family permease
MPAIRAFERPERPERPVAAVRPLAGVRVCADATTQTIAWCVIFLFASAGASAAYLTVSEIFPMETRAMAIAFFYATGTIVGGFGGPVPVRRIDGALIQTGEPSQIFVGYLVGAP